jgi:regulator of replication initiation timing
MGILDDVKAITKAVQEVNNLDLYQRVLTLHSDVIALVEDNIRLRDENKELQRTLALKPEMRFREPFYYREGDQTPHCSACWEANQKVVHVTFVTAGGRSTRWDCPHCKQVYWDGKDRSGTSSVPVRGQPYGRGPHGWMGS